MTGHDIIVIGASLGGVEALPRLVSQLSEDLPAALFVVQHTTAHTPSYLGQILERAGPLKAKLAQDHEPIKNGMIYTAPPDHHLLVKAEQIRVIRGPRENRVRPAVDPLFRSAAANYGGRVIGVILTGLLDDGTAGLLAVKRAGGIAIVQDPKDAAHPDMPESALANVAVDYCLPITEMGGVLEELVRQPVGEVISIPQDIVLEAEIAERVMDNVEINNQLGTLASLACPECQGPLWRIENGQFQRYRCNVGHAFTSRTLLTEQSQAVEQALWVALRTLEDRVKVLTSMARKEEARNRNQVLLRYEEEAAEIRRHAQTIRGLLLNGNEMTKS